jgi:hypothetical protein
VQADQVLRSPAAGVVVVWASSALAAAFAPDMITGSEHEYIPIVAVSIWLWTLVATGYVLLASQGGGVTPTLTLGTTGIWLAVLFVVLFTPRMVTGSDPTEIPIAGFVAPPVGAVATGFLALQQARADRRSEG